MAHGRIKPLEGEFYDNIFVHFRLRTDSKRKLWKAENEMFSIKEAKEFQKRNQMVDSKNNEQ